MFTPIHTCKILYTSRAVHRYGAKVWRFTFYFFVYVPLHNCHQQCRSTEKHNFFSCVLFVYIYQQQEDKIGKILKKASSTFLWAATVLMYREINSHLGTYCIEYLENIHLEYLGIFCYIFMYSALKSLDFFLGIFRGKNWNFLPLQTS